MNVQRTVPLLYVSDTAASSRFYCDGLGFQMTRKWEPDGRLAWCWLRRGGADLMIQQAEDGDLPADRQGLKSIAIYFLCENADAIHADITARGIDATEPGDEFYGMRQVFVTDPDGYQLCFENPIGEDDETS